MERAATGYLIAVSLGIAVYVAVPWSIPQIGAQYVAHVLVAVGVIIVGLRQHRPRRPLLWWGLAATLLVWALGDVFWFTDAARGTLVFPSPADGPYLVGYLTLMLALGWLALVRQQDRRAGDVLDALLISIGVGVPIWLIAVGPAWAAGDTGEGLRYVGTAYAIIVLLLVTLIAWLLSGGLFTTPSGKLLTAGVTALIVANLGYSIDLFAALYDRGGGLDVG